MLVYLINQTINGRSPERRPARFILDCLRAYATRPEVEACINRLKRDALLNIEADARELAKNVGLIKY